MARALPPTAVRTHTDEALASGGFIQLPTRDRVAKHAGMGIEEGPIMADRPSNGSPRSGRCMPSRRPVELPVVA